jgi:ABC-2 type transport system permease protein
VRALAYETYYLGLRTSRRFIRVPANWISIILFPLIQLLVFSQLYQQIVQLPGFGAQTSYLAYLVPGQVAFTAFLAVSWSGSALLVEYRSGYMDKLRAAPISRWSILAGEMVPLFFETAVMAGVLLLAGILLGTSIATGLGGFVLILVLSGLFGVAWSGTSFVPALLTKSEQATSALSFLFFPVAFVSTAFVPATLMPAWLQALNAWNPITYLIEAIRGLLVSGYDWVLVGRALLAIGLVGAVLQLLTFWAFGRLAR